MMMVASRFRQIRFAGILLVALLTFGCATYSYQEDPNIDDNGRFGAWTEGPDVYYNASMSLFEESGGIDHWYQGYDDDYHAYPVGGGPGYWRH